MPSRIIVALDGMRWTDAIALASYLNKEVWGFKLNDGLFAELCDLSVMLAYGNLMIDPKLYDIPATVGNSVAKLVECTRPKSVLITVHATAGLAAMRAAVEACEGTAMILAITALTSFTDAELFRIYQRERKDLVRILALSAYEAGVPGLVCSTDDLKIVHDMPFLKVVPGIRLPGDDKNDQVQTGDGAGADLVVIGRPITKAKDPLDAVRRINAFLEGAVSGQPAGQTK